MLAVSAIAHQTLSRRQEATSSDQPQTSSTMQATGSTSSSMAQSNLYIYIGLGIALGVLLLLGVTIVVCLTKRYRRRRKVNDLEAGEAVPQQMHETEESGKERTRIYLVPGQSETVVPAPDQSAYSSTLPEKEQSQRVQASATTASKSSKHQSRPSGILRRFSAFLDSTTDEPTQVVDQHGTEASITNTLRFPQFDQVSSPGDNTLCTPDSSVAYMTSAIGAAEQATESSQTSAAGSTHGAKGSNSAVSKFRPEGNVFRSMSRRGRDSSRVRSAKSPGPPSLPPVGQVSPLRVPQPRRDTIPNARTRKRLSTGPMLRPHRRSLFGSKDLQHAVGHDRHASLKSVTSSQWQSPQRSVFRSRSRGARLTSGRSRPSTRSTTSRAGSDAVSRRSASAGSSETSDSRFNRLSVHQIETANQVSIKRVNSTASFRGAIRGVKKITTPISRFGLKTSVSDNGSPISRKRTSFGKRLSIIRDNTPKKEAPSVEQPRGRYYAARSGANDSHDTFVPTTPPKQTSSIRFHGENARNTPLTRDSTTPSRQNSSSIYFQRSFHSGNAYYSRDISPTTPPRQISYHDRQLIHNDSDDDIFGFDPRTHSPRSRSTPRGRKHFRQQSGSTVSPVTPDAYGSHGLSPVPFSDPRILHGIEEEAESDDETVAPRLHVAKAQTQPIKPEQRLEPTRSAWRLSSPTLPTASAHHSSVLSTQRLDLGRNGSTASRQSVRSSASHLSIPLFPSTPSNRMRNSSGAVKATPAIAYPPNSDLSSLNQSNKTYINFSSPKPFASPSNYTSPSTYFPSSPPVAAPQKSALYDPAAAPHVLSSNNTKDKVLYDPLSPPIASADPSQNAAMFQSMVGPDTAVSRRASSKPVVSKQLKRSQGADITGFGAAGGGLALEGGDMDTMQRRINSALEGFGGDTKADVPTDAANLQELLYDSGLEDDDIWEAPKLPAFQFDLAPLFSSAANSPARRAPRSPRQATKI